MRSWARLLVIWCMAIALPLQALASASMLHCSHARAMAAAVDAGQPPMSAHAMHGHPPAVADQHGAHDTADHAMADHTAPAAAADPAAPADLTPPACSACAACCAGPALPSAAPRLPQPATVPAVFAALVVSLDRFSTGGPDRPPRTRPV